MTKLLIILIFSSAFVMPCFASEITAPAVPKSGLCLMPNNTESFGDGLWELLVNSGKIFRPELENALEIGYSVIFVIFLFSLLSLLSEQAQRTLSIAGTAAVTSIMFQNANGMIVYAAEVVQEICEYGKLLCPVMTMSLAAQGGVAASAALYTGTIIFISILSIMVSKVLVPMVYMFLAFSVSNCAFGDEIMKNMSAAVKSVIAWILKTLLIVFTTYMSITGVVSGTTDAASLKATKVMISSAVPVVGGVLSDVSESVLVSMGIMKNAVGVYGVLAVLAVIIGPFLKVGAQYLVLKGSAVMCNMFGNKNLSALLDDFSAAMGILLAMVATGSLLVLFSTVCFMKGIG